MTNPPTMSRDCAAWARSAGYICDSDELAGSTVLRPELGGPTRYLLGWRGSRVELSQTLEDDERRRVVLFAANGRVVERFLYGLFGDDIRDELELPYLERPWSVNDLAPEFELGDFDGGYRILHRRGEGPVAAAAPSS